MERWGYNSLEVIFMDSLKKAIEMIKELPVEKITTVIRFMEILQLSKSNSLDEIIYRAWESTLEEDELSPEEMKRVEEGKEILKKGLGVKESDFWKELGT